MTDLARLGIAIDATSAETAAKSLDKMADSSAKAETATEKMEKAIRANMTEAERFIANLERQTTLHGKSATEALRYDASLIKMTVDQRAEAEALIKIADEQERANKKTATWIDLVKGAAVAMGAYKLFDYAKDAALLSARYETLGTVMGVVGNNAGYSSAQMEGYAKELQHSGIAMLESRELVTKLAQAHMDLGNASKLARVAQDAAVIGGINSTEAMERLTYGIQSAQTDVLRSIGINVNFEQSYAKLAAQLKKNVNDLSEVEKTQARTNAVMEAGSDIAGSYEKAMGTAGKQITSMKRYMDDFKLTVGEVFNEATTVAVMAFTDGFKDLNGEARDLAEKNQLKEWGESVTNVMAFAGDAVISATIPFRLVGNAIAVVAAQTYALMHGDFEAMEAIKQAGEEQDAAILKSASMFRDALQERRAAIAEDKKKLLKNDEDYLKATADLMKQHVGDSIETQQRLMRELTEKFYPEFKKQNEAEAKQEQENLERKEVANKAIRDRYRDIIKRDIVGDTQFAISKIEERYKKEYDAIAGAKDEIALRALIDKQKQAEIDAVWSQSTTYRASLESILTDNTKTEAEKRVAIERAAAGQVLSSWEKANSARAGSSGNGYVDSNGNLAFELGATMSWSDFINEGKSVKGFATGGSFMVGGSGSTDSQLVQFMASPDERVTIETPEQQRKSGDSSAAPVFHITMNGVNDPAELSKQLQQYVRSNPLALSAAGILRRPG